MCYEIEITPQDVLFFRDAKPMEASSVGTGARWPLPNVLHDAFLSAFHSKWIQRQEWEFKHLHTTKNDRNWSSSSKRFGGLKSMGIFPTLNGEICFPKPADIAMDGSDIAEPQKKRGVSNLPEFLQYTLLNSSKESKNSAGEWLTASGMNEYLNGKPPAKKNLIKTSDIYEAESRVGIAIDPETGTADTGSDDESGKLYIAEYMRLKQNTGIRGFVDCISSRREEGKTDVIEKFFGERSNEKLVFGGQRGIAAVTHKRIQGFIPTHEKSETLLIKWILLTPAVFTNGWYPGWIDKNGSVRLPAEKPLRKSGETREEWRARFGAAVKARLVAASTEKPQTISGWNLSKGEPRRTLLAVPAGAVYYFEAESSADAQALTHALQGHCKSDYYGEKGFGLGICGTWAKQTRRK